VPLTANEVRWLPVLAPLLPVAVPVPVRTGSPGAGYPWPWTVVPWIAGTLAADEDPPHRSVWAADLARALVALHRPADRQAPPNPYRGVPLAARDDVVRSRLAASPEPALLLDRWDAGLVAPAWDGPPLWLHGDPHPANLVVDGGRLTGLIDFGDLTAGDPASDLATAWLTFDRSGRALLRAELARSGHPADEATWTRARAWAAALASAFTSLGDGDPAMAAVARHAIGQLALDA
jgi:aminoglycoside phosphotransferase (APT) family kinase protein